MEMIISQQLQRELSANLRENALSDGETRRIEGMGNLYVSLKREPVPGCYFRYTLTIEGIDYHFFSKNEE
jgi:hypothetical protein